MEDQKAMLESVQQSNIQIVRNSSNPRQSDDRQHKKGNYEPSENEDDENREESE